MLQQFYFRLRSLWRWRRQESELDEEIRFHLAEEADERMAEGLSPEDARMTARREFGNVTLVRELTRETWGWGAAERLWRDLRFGGRMLARRWRLSTTIGLTIAVTVGASITLLSVVTPVLLTPLPFSDAERLYRIEPRDANGRRVWVSLPTFADWQDRLRDARVAGYSVLDFSVFGEEGSEPILAARVTDDLLDLLDVRMTLGRTFDDEEYLAGSPRGVILSHAFWQRRYGADPTIIGRSIELVAPPFIEDEGADYRVVGVLAPEFWLFSNRLEIVVPWRPALEPPVDRRRGALETVLAKFEPGVTQEAAAARVSDMVSALALQYGAAERVASASATHAQAAHYRAFRSGLLIALISAILMFVLAIVNVAGTMLALTVARRREYAVPRRAGRLAIRIAPTGARGRAASGRGRRRPGTVPRDGRHGGASNDGARPACGPHSGRRGRDCRGRPGRRPGGGRGAAHGAAVRSDCLCGQRRCAARVDPARGVAGHGWRGEIQKGADGDPRSAARPWPWCWSSPPAPCPSHSCGSNRSTWA